MKARVQNGDNIEKVEFGTTEPNTTEVDAEQERRNEYIKALCFTIGKSALDYVLCATKEEYLKHMEELYDHFNANKQDDSKIIVPDNQIILP